MIHSQNRYIRKTREIHRVVVTGIGAVTPLGLTLEESWKNLLRGESGIKRLSRFDTADFDVKVAGEIRGFEPENYIDAKDVKKMDLFIQYALAAAQMALEKANLQNFSKYHERAGIIIGTSMGGMPGVEHQHKRLLQKGPQKVNPFFIPSVLANMASARVAIKYGIKGPQFTLKSACATGAHSIGEAFRYIADGSCDAMIAGGTEANISPLTFAGFSALQGISKNPDPELASRPWDKDRDGFVVSEGACIFVLESLDHALSRNAHILAEITGYAATSDAYHVTAPNAEGEGVRRAIEVALLNAGVDSCEVDCINAHSASTKIGDTREINSIRQALTRIKENTYIISNKAQLGHCLGAAGAIESAFSIMSILEKTVPAQKNLFQPDVDLSGFRVGGNPSEKLQIRNVLKTSMGFGGTNSALLFSEYQLERD